MNFKKLREEATKLADAVDADIFFYSGDISSQYQTEFVRLGNGKPRRTNVILVLCTLGGVPDAAYKMARFLQEDYKKFTLLVTGKCKSSGTLIALGAHEIAMGDHAELGPLDIQLGKKDELFENDSGLTVLNAITELESKAYELFESGFVRLKYRTGGRMTMKTATALASELAIGMIAPVISQIDPLHVGEVSRAMKVAKEYGERLSKKSENLQAEALKKLINEYPSHGFVIDRSEASELFRNVRKPTEAEYVLIREFGASFSSIPMSDDPLTFVLSHPKHQETQNAGNQQANAPENPVEQAAGNEPNAGGGGIEQAPAGEPAANDDAQAA